jgi:transcriptional regulator with PAS, ATPase and Fis domain
MLNLEITSILPLLEAIVSYIDEGVLIAGGNDDVVYMNPAAYHLLDLPINTPVRTLRDVPKVDLQEVVVGGLEASRRADAATRKMERRIPVAGGHRDLAFECCMGSEPNSQLQLLIVRDVTQRRILEAFQARTSGDLVTNDPAMAEILERVQQVAPAMAPVLLLGESGTGKTHIARLIHRMSKRSQGPFVEVNCAAIPETLLESELFGHVKGAFTGATQSRKGRFQAADKGTIFLDEIGELPLHLQAKLLRAIQDQEFEPVGADKPVRVDIRIVAASNRSLREMVDKRAFRSDLYYRLAVIPIYVPALRERAGDIPVLLKHFCYGLASRGYPSDVQCSAEAMRMLMSYPWPGNVRELQNAVEHALICAVDKVVVPESLPTDIRRHFKAAMPEAGRIAAAGASGGDPERIELEAALARAQGHKSRAAEILGIDRTTLWRRMRKFNLRAHRRAGAEAGRSDD